MRKGFKIITVVFILILGISGFFAYFSRVITSPAGGGIKQQVTIAPGATANEVAHMLEAQGLIRKAYIFKWFCKFAKVENRLKAGTYSLSSEQTPLEILQALIKGSVNERWVTFPEGVTLRDIERILLAAGFSGCRGFAAEAAHYGFEIPGQLKLKGVEGFLFPDTYKIPVHYQSQDIIQMMLKRFTEISLPVYEASGRKPAFSLKDVVTLASLVEREAKVKHERPMIAAVYYNRLQQGMKLECDATIQYLLPEVKPELTFEDLKRDSPYNTYKYQGLPPGPICCPGKAALDAACHPAQVPYLFYVLNDKTRDGSHVFTKDYNAHLKAVQQYLR